MQRFEHARDWHPPEGYGWFIYWDHCACGRTQNYGEARRSPVVKVEQTNG